MKQDVPFSSKRLLLTLTLCACAVILLQNHDLSTDLPFPLQLGSLAAGLAVCLLLFVPAIRLKLRYDSDVPSLALRRSKAEQITVAVLYTLYFLFVAAYFLLPYTAMFCQKYYTETSPAFVALLLLACCVYAAYKGVNVITRFGIFLFVLALLTNALLFGGCISEVDFRNGSFGVTGNMDVFWRDALYYTTPCFTAALFACLSKDALRFRWRHVVFSLGASGVKYALVMFFLTFAAGEYAERQAFPTFVLSRVAHFGSFAGVESLYMALSTMSVFMTVSLLLCGVTKMWGKGGSLRLIAVLTAVIFGVQLLALRYPFITAVLTSPLWLTGLTVLTATVLPTVYLLRERRQHA